MAASGGAGPQPTTGASLLRGDFRLQLLIAGLAIFAVHATRPIVTYQAIALGASTVEIGVIQSAFSLLPALTAVALGRVVDRGGDTKYLVMAMLLYSLGTGGAALAGSLLLLTLTQLLGGMGHILNLVASQTMVANRGPREQRDGRFAAYFVANSIGQFAGPALAGLVAGSVVAGAVVAGTVAGGYELADGQRVFWIATFSTLVALGLASILLVHDRARGTLTDADPREQPRENILQATRRVSARAGMPTAMTVSIIVVSAMDVLMAYLPAYGESVGLAVATVGLLLSARAGASLVARLFMSRAIGQFGKRWTMAGSLVLAGVGVGALAVTSEIWWLLVASVATGVGLGLSLPLTISWVADRSPRAERATALGVRITATRVALLVAPTLMGAIAGAAGIIAIFGALALLLFAAAAIAARTPFDDLVATPSASDQES